jgi:hypothetical protein
MRDYTTSLTQIKVKEHERLYNITHTSLTHIKVKEHERLYNITHTYQSKGTRETIQHHSHISK